LVHLTAFKKTNTFQAILKVPNKSNA